MAIEGEGNSDGTPMKMGVSFLDPKIWKMRWNFYREKLFFLGSREIVFVKAGCLDVFFYRRFFLA